MLPLISKNRCFICCGNIAFSWHVTSFHIPIDFLIIGKAAVVVFAVVVVIVVVVVVVVVAVVVVSCKLAEEHSVASIM